MWHGQGCPLFNVVHPAFPLPTTASPTVQSALMDGFGEAVVACNMPKPSTFPSPDSCQKRFLWTNTEVEIAPHPVVELMLQVGMRRSFFRHLVSEAWILFFFRVSKQVSCFTVIGEDGGDKRLAQLKLACEADGGAPPDLV